MSTKPKCYSYIRFSTLHQKEESLKRQTAAAQKWADDNGYVLDNSLKMVDEGKSSYSGAHVKKGAFGQFLDLVNDGKIEKGSILLCESLDRLSRQDPARKALPQLISITDAGITVITLMDNQRYTQENLDSMKLLYSILIMSRAHEESATKSSRLLSKHHSKRADLRNKKSKILTKNCPDWLKWDDEKGEFVLIPERAKTVKRIYELAKDGYGIHAITKKLNADKSLYWNNEKGFFHSTIGNILSSKTVIGEIQPHERKAGKREPSGEPIVGYYPRAITDDLFYAVRKSIESRRTKVGRQSKNVGMLFSHLAFCAYCGGAMSYVTKGIRGTYLICYNSTRGMGCKYFSYPYHEFERTILTTLREVDPQTLVPKSKADEAQIELEAVDGKIILNEKAIVRINNKFVEGDIPDSLIDTLKRLEKEQKALKEKLKVLREKLKMEKSPELVNIQEITSQMDGLKGDELNDYRMKLREAIRKVVEKIMVFPGGPTKDEKGKPIEMNRKNRFFILHLKNEVELWDPPGGP